MKPVGVILAGGRARRLGSEKALVSLAGRPLLTHVVERLRPQVALYIAGLFDGLTTTGTNDWEPITRHYDRCIEKAKLTIDQLVENVLAYGQSRPQFHAKPVAGAMINYLVEVCGTPPQACGASPAAAP